MGRKQRKNIFLENIEVLRAGAKGVSIGKTEDGITVLIQDAVPGDLVNVSVHKKKSSYLEGKATEIIRKSAHRVEPKCIHFGVCGGCKWQNLDYAAQLQFKQDEVEKVAREVLVCTSLVCLVVLISDTELTALVKSNVLALIQKWNKVCSWITNLDIRYLVLCT